MQGTIHSPFLLIPEPRFPHNIHPTHLVHLLLLVNAVLAGSAVYEQEKTTDD